MPTMIAVKCMECGKDFSRLKCEVEGNKRRGYLTFCSLSCASKSRNRRFPSKGNIANFHGKLGVSRDEFSPFRYFLKRIKTRKRQEEATNNGHKRFAETDLTLQLLKNQWEKQSGICPFTGWKLLLPHSTEGWEGEPQPNKASLDRIDNTKGYTVDNIRFVAFIFNVARNTFSDAQVIEMCKAIAQKF